MTEGKITNLKAEDKKSDEVMIGDYTEAQLLERAQTLVAKRTETWEIASAAAEARIPKFQSKEIEIGNTYGKGGFFEVKEVKSIKLLDDDKEQEQPELHPLVETEDYIQGVVQDRLFMQKHCLRQEKKATSCRYAIKSPLPICFGDPSTFVNTIVDLMIEAKFLSVVRHPNIIKMRATSCDLCSPHSFLILDRLYDTLSERILQWEHKSRHWMQTLFDFQKKKEKAFIVERLTVAYDVASALSYLHDLNIIYRDLKPNNVGFDVRGDAKLFDFGLATEFDSGKAKKGYYRLTGNTGTIRYMAPEVALSQGYTEKADVYSFGILLWHMLALEMPYRNLPDDAVERKVFQCGGRPKIDGKWPSDVRRLLQDCFASAPRRPQMTAACEILRKEIKNLGGEKLNTVQRSYNNDVNHWCNGPIMFRFLNISWTIPILLSGFLYIYLRSNDRSVDSPSTS